MLNAQGQRGIAKSDEVAYIFGVDWYGLEESLVSMQLNQSYLLSSNDGFSRPKLSYELDEESLVYTGLDIFYGSRDGLYGQFREQNRVVLGVERTF